MIYERHPYENGTGEITIRSLRQGGFKNPIDVAKRPKFLNEIER